MLKKLFIALLGLQLTFVPFGSSQTKAATLIPLDGTISGSIEAAETGDVYQIQLDKPGRITLTTKTYLTGLKVKVVDQDEATEFYSTNVWNGSPSEPKQDEENLDLEAGTYYIKANKLDGYTGNYQLKLHFTPANNNDIEANNSATSAQPLTLNANSIKGFLSKQDSIDYYKIQLDKPGRINVTTKSYLSGINASIIASDEVTGVESDNIWNGSVEEPKSLTQTTDLEAGIYFIKIKSLDGYTGTYDLNVTYLGMNNQDVEPNQVIENAQSLFLDNKYTTGFISWSDNLDLYKMTLAKPGKITLTAVSYFSGMKVELLDKELDQTVVSSNIWNGTPSEPKRWEPGVDLEAGTYYLRVKNMDGYTGKYQLKLNYKAANNLDKTNNDTTNTAQELKLNSSLTGYITWSDYVDVYKIKLTKSGKISFNTISYASGLKVQLLKSNGVTAITSNNIWNGSTKSPKQWGNTVSLSAGTYYLKVDKLDGYTGKYQIKVNLLDTTPPSQPKVNKVKANSSYITGKTEAYASVSAYVGKSKIGSAKADKNGYYKMKISRKKSGTSITIYAKDKTGNTSKSTKIKVSK